MYQSQSIDSKTSNTCLAVHTVRNGADISRRHASTLTHTHVAVSTTQQSSDDSAGPAERVAAKANACTYAGKRHTMACVRWIVTRLQQRVVGEGV